MDSETQKETLNFERGKEKFNSNKNLNNDISTKEGLQKVNDKLKTLTTKLPEISTSTPLRKKHGFKMSTQNNSTQPESQDVAIESDEVLYYHNIKKEDRINGLRRAALKKY